MKKFLEILGVIIIVGSKMPLLVGNAPTPEKNNLKTLNRNKRNNDTIDVCCSNIVYIGSIKSNDVKIIEDALNKNEKFKVLLDNGVKIKIKKVTYNEALIEITNFSSLTNNQIDAINNHHYTYSGNYNDPNSLDWCINESVLIRVIFIADNIIIPDSEDEIEYIGTYNLSDSDNDSSFNSDISSNSIEEIVQQISNHNHWLLNDIVRNTDLNLINSNSEEDIINAVINNQDSRIRPFLRNNIRVVNDSITDFGALIEWEPKIYNQVNHNLDQLQEQFGVVFYVNFILKNKKINILQNTIIQQNANKNLFSQRVSVGEQPGTSGTNQRVSVGEQPGTSGTNQRVSVGEQPGTSGTNQRVSVGEQPGTSGTNQRVLKVVIPYHEKKIVDTLINRNINKLKITNTPKYFGVYNKKNNKKSISYFRISNYKKHISSFFKKTNLGNITDINYQKILSRLIEINRSFDNIPSELLTESNLYVTPSSITENSAIVTINAYRWSYGSNINFRYRGSIRVAFNTNDENISNQNLETQQNLEEVGSSGLSNHIQKDNDDELDELIDESNGIVNVSEYLSGNNEPINNSISSLKLESLQNNLINFGNIKNNSREYLINVIRKYLYEIFNLIVNKESINIVNYITEDLVEIRINSIEPEIDINFFVEFYPEWTMVSNLNNVIINRELGTLPYHEPKERGSIIINEIMARNNLNNLNIRDLNIRFENTNIAILSVNNRNRNYFGEVEIEFSLDYNTINSLTNNFNNNNDGDSSDEEKFANKKIWYEKLSDNTWMKKDYSSEDSDSDDNKLTISTIKNNDICNNNFVLWGSTVIPSTAGGTIIGSAVPGMGTVIGSISGFVIGLGSFISAKIYCKVNK
ncbi:hypothetical protein [Spiroplasma endosymbiont of Clivina fossor]|uniref:hypothetical protein n=1 Tax=Spiroplasma endosymbiont of Clivina fossor TaxID=3066282 RepID=UPI00313E1365